MAMPVVSPALVWALGEKLKNWAGNFEYSTERLYSANSLQEVRDFVGKQARLKVLGTRHCFNRIADSTDYLLSSKQ
jgi:alditol oxidase